MPAALQARADAEMEAEAPREQTSFRSLLAELDGMEQGLKVDFDDLLYQADEPPELPDETASSGTSTR